MKVYFDLGKGFSEEHKMVWSIPDRLQSLRVEKKIVVPEGCVAIRYDPTEKYVVEVSDIHLIGNNGEIPLAWHNGFVQDGIIGFKTADPQFVFRPIGASASVVLKVSISSVDTVAAIRSLMGELSGMQQRLRDEVEKRKSREESLLDGIAKHAARAEALRGTVDACKATEARLRAAIEADKEREAKLRAALEVGKEREASLRGGIARHQARAEALRTTVDTCKATEARLRAALEAGKATETQLRAALAAGKGREKDLSDELARGKAQARALQRRIVLFRPYSFSQEERRRLRRLAFLHPIRCRRLVAEMRLIASSPLFDAEYYCQNNAEAAQAPLLHFCQQGWRCGRNPSALFDINDYLNGDQTCGPHENPLAHFLQREGERHG